MTRTMTTAGHDDARLAQLGARAGEDWLQMVHCVGSVSLALAALDDYRLAPASSRD